MKIIITETENKNPENLYTYSSFRIVGEQNKKTGAVPVWESSIQLTKIEGVQREEGYFEKLKAGNAQHVFNKFYQDTFGKSYPQS